MSFQAELKEIEEEGSATIRSADTLEALERARVELLGRKARLTRLLRTVGELPAEDRPKAGQAANQVKQHLQALLEARTVELAGRAESTPIEQDLTLPGRPRWRGGRHPVTRVIDEICAIFARLGFVRARGPEVETLWYNFEALNTPLDHPAADIFDTLYLSDDLLLRTHTSPVQARVMERVAPPVRIVVPGLVYRRDTPDASHLPAFSQIEGLAVDEGITFVDLKAALVFFAHRLFGENVKTRFRPSFFPFTEPSAELDVSCGVCGGRGCSACKGTGWLEVLGCGMVDPAVFENVGYDPERYTGYAFGMGVERIAMLRYGVPDIRMFYEADVRFLEQFVDG